MRKRAPKAAPISSSKKSAQASACRAATCKFGLKIANAGTMPYNGDVLLADAMFVGGAAVNAPVTAVNPPIACIAGNTNQLPFTCVTPLSLMPGEEHTHWVDVTMPAPGGYWAHNCFGALDPALLPVGPVPPGLGARRRRRWQPELRLGACAGSESQLETQEDRR